MSVLDARPVVPVGPRTVTIEVFDVERTGMINSALSSNVPALCDNLRKVTGINFQYKGFSNKFLCNEYPKFVMVVQDGIYSKNITSDIYFNLSKAGAYREAEFGAVVDTFLACLRSAGFSL